ncbi:MAG TPA: SDR family oxidoreductase [Candidatus Kapabacteria bacterium]|nr:SDR family oxidoreductase [Candidatus Kapabacteria bacterium]
MSTLFITGSSGGLGSAIRAFYLDKGWKVAGFDAFDNGFRSDNFLFTKIDSTNEASVAEAFGSASKSLGEITQLISTIGGLKPWSTVEDLSVDDFRFVMDLNLLSTFLCTREAIRLMKPEASGSIVTIGADTALHSEPKKSAYIAAKAGVIAFTQAIAEETKEYGITANCILPKVIHTKANEEWGTPEEIPRWTDPADIAAFCYYLASESGKAINGAAIRLPNKA